MITSLDFISSGKPWPPTDAHETARLAEHVYMRDVYNGLHDKIFPCYISYLSDATKDHKKQSIILDWPELATTSYLNLLLGEDPEVVVDRDDLPERPDEEVFIDVSRYGHGFYEITQDGIIAINPENVYLVVQPGNIRKVEAYVIFSQFDIIGEDKKPHTYIKFTIHTVGQIQHLLFELKNGKLFDQMDIKKFPSFVSLKVDDKGIQKTGVNDVLIVHVNNAMSSERYYGRSDYRPSILTLVEALELSFAQRDEVLAKFTSPTPIVPESATTFDHAEKEWVYKSGKPIITAPGDLQPSLMVWQAELGAVEKSIEQKIDQLLQMLQLSKVLLAGKDAGTAESGTALRIRLIPTLSKVSKYARAAEKAIPKVINLWSILNGPEIPIDKISINLQDGIPEDPIETANTALIWDQMGGVSLERKLVLQGMKEGSEAFDEELKRIQSAPSPLDKQF